MLNMENLENVTEDSILLFEYFTANGVNDLSIISEAAGMIKELADDLKNLDTYLIISKKFENLFNNVNVNLITINEPLNVWLNNNANKFKKSIFIADEGEEHLLEITKILEKNNVKLYCSNSNSVMVCTNKFLTYNNLKNIVKQPITSKLEITSNYSWKNSIKKILKKINNQKDVKLIVKPIDGVDCERVSLIHNENDLNILEKFYPVGSKILVQEYIEGDSCSVSLLTDGETAIPLSLNKQNILINNEYVSYCGGELPYNHSLEKEAFELATSAVENIEGLKGFVGVDLIINNEVTFLEINSRFTTPYVGLKTVINFNIGEAIIKLLDQEISIENLKNNISLNGKVKFVKDGNDLKIKKL
jgi:predicted ATP-grasp superfamily ATP-dependent carboligase